MVRFTYRELDKGDYGIIRIILKKDDRADPLDKAMKVAKRLGLKVKRPHGLPILTVNRRR